MPRAIARQGPPGPLGWWSAECAEAAAWCRERSALPRILVLLWLGSILVYLWRDPALGGPFDWPNLFSGINLGIHELGHVVFAPFGMFLGVLGGSLLQCVAPIAGAFVLRRQSDFFGVAVCGGWLATNLFGVGVYVADARAQALPLVSPFSGHPLHDWGYLLGRMGWLGACEELGLLAKLLATAVMALSLALGAWLALRMLQDGGRRGVGLGTPR
jgi:hypothetical protein